MADVDRVPSAAWQPDGAGGTTVEIRGQGVGVTAARTPLLIDCDTGIDDALALLYACASPDAEIVGVSCVAGNVELPHVVRNTLAVMELAGRGEVEVAAGRDAPIARPLRIADDTHGPTGLGYAQLPSRPWSPGPGMRPR